MARLRERLAEMRHAVGAALRRDIAVDRVTFEEVAEMRYAGQRHPLRVSLREGDRPADIHARFVSTYRERYGHADESGALEFVGLRVSGSALTERPDVESLHRAGSGGSPQPRSHREVHFPQQGRVRTPVLVRNSLPVGFRLEGPAVVEEFGATTLLGPADRLEVGALGELRIEVRA
jgi:N-methylhydantoinase A